MSTQKLQRCYVCDALTGRCEEDSIYLPPKDPNGSDLGPLCEACCDELDPPKPGLVWAGCDKGLIARGTPTPPLPRKKPAVFHHPIGFELYDALAMDLHAMTYAEPLFAEIARLTAALREIGDLAASARTGPALREVLAAIEKLCVAHGA